MAELLEMRDGSTVSDPRLGRLPQFDERSRNFRVASHPMMAQPVKTVIWEVPEPLNQFSEGTCVGHGYEAEAGSKPVAVRPCSHNHALTWFDRAAAIDEFPGENRNNGTSVLAGAKVGVQLGFFSAYRWCFSQIEIYAALQEGPVVVGTDWLTRMFDPDPEGRLHVEGSVEGGHCWLIYGLVLKGDINPFTGLPAPEDIYLMQNSWGLGWGINGRAWITTTDFESLRRAGADVCVPINRHDPYKRPAPKPKPIIKKKWYWDRFRGWVRSLGNRKARATT